MNKKRGGIYHYETPDIEALCRRKKLLCKDYVPVNNTTLNPKYVTCLKCRKLMVAQGIIKPEEIDNFER